MICRSVFRGFISPVSEVSDKGERGVGGDSYTTFSSEWMRHSNFKKDYFIIHLYLPEIYLSLPGWLVDWLVGWAGRLIDWLVGWWDGLRCRVWACVWVRAEFRGSASERGVVWGSPVTTAHFQHGRRPTSVRPTAMTQIIHRKRMKNNTNR